MKNATLIKTALTLAACIVLFAAAAPAQTLKANVPFAFMANGNVMPAGEYRVTIDSARGLLTVGRPGEAAVFVPVQNRQWGASSNEGMMVFHRYGDRVYLKRIKAPAATDGMEAFPSKAEKEASRSGNPLEVAMIRVLAQ